MHYYTIFTAYVAIVGTIATLVAPTAQPTPNIEQAHEEAEEEPASTPELVEIVKTASPAPEKSQRELNREYVEVYGQAKFGSDQVPALLELVNRESGFDNLAKNPRSTAFGLFQFIRATWGAYGYEQTSDPIIQIEAGLDYIEKRYGTPQKALQFHNINHWY